MQARTPALLGFLYGERSESLAYRHDLNCVHVKVSGPGRHPMYGVGNVFRSERLSSFVHGCCPLFVAFKTNFGKLTSGNETGLNVGDSNRCAE